MSDPHASLAARREALVRQCAEQRDQLALEVYSLRAPLDGGPVGAARGAIDKLRGGLGHLGNLSNLAGTISGVVGGVVNRLPGGKLRLPVLLGAGLAGALLVKRGLPVVRNGVARVARGAELASQGKAHAARALSLWTTLQPVLAMLRRH